MSPTDESQHVVMLRDTLRRFLDKEAPRHLTRQWDRDDRLPREVLDKLADLGVMSLTVPEEYGGTGRDIPATMVVIEELASRSLGLCSGYIMGACYAGMNLVELGSEAQKRTLLPGVAEGKVLFAYGITEPDTGADVASIRTTAERRGDVLVINGAKRFCSGAASSNFIYAVVRSGPATERHKNLSIVLVPPTAPGVALVPQETLGMRGLPACDVSFQDVEVPVANIVGGEDGWNRGWAQLVGPGLDVERLEVAAMALGIASAAIEDAWSYSQERKQFGKPICSFQSIRHVLAEVRTKFAACRLMVHHAATLVNHRAPAAVETAMTKLFVCDTAVEIVLACQRIMGAYGYASEFLMERYVRDVLAMPILGGSSAIQKNNISNRLGLPR